MDIVGPFLKTGGKPLFFNRRNELAEKPDAYYFKYKSYLRQSISKYPALKNASQSQHNSYELISNGVGIHWKDLDEDLSLKGFLKDEIK